MATGAPTTATARRRLTIFVTALSTVAAIPVWAVPRFPSQDGPWLDLQAVVLRAVAAGADRWRGFYVPDLGGRISGTFAIRWLTWISRWTSVYQAERLLVTLCIMALGPAALYFLRRVQRDAQVWALVAPGLALSWSLARGYYGYAAGLPLLLVTLGRVLPQLDGSGGGRGWLVEWAAFLVALAFAHPLLPPLALVVASSWALLELDGERRPRAILAILAGALPAIAMVAPSLFAALTAGPLVVETIPHAAVWFIPHLAYDQDAPALLLVGAVVVVAGTSFVRRAIRATLAARNGGWLIELRPEHAWPCAIGVIMAAAMLFPDAGPGFTGVAGRLSLPLLLLAVAWLPVPARATRPFAIGLCVVSLALVFMNLRALRHLAPQLHDYCEASAIVPEGALVLPATFAAPRPGRDVDPFLHAWAYAAIDRGLRVPVGSDPARLAFVHVEPPAGVLVPDEDFASRIAYRLLACNTAPSLVSCDSERRGGYASLIASAFGYDRLVAWRAPAEFLGLAAAAGYAPEATSGPAAVLRAASR